MTRVPARESKREGADFKPRIGRRLLRDRPRRQHHQRRECRGANPARRARAPRRTDSISGATPHVLHERRLRALSFSAPPRSTLLSSAARTDRAPAKAGRTFRGHRLTDLADRRSRIGHQPDASKKPSPVHDAPRLPFDFAQKSRGRLQPTAPSVSAHESAQKLREIRISCLSFKPQRHRRPDPTTAPYRPP